MYDDRILFLKCKNFVCLHFHIIANECNQLFSHALHNSLFTSTILGKLYFFPNIFMAAKKKKKAAPKKKKAAKKGGKKKRK